jgi:hypothetical protein
MFFKQSNGSAKAVDNSQPSSERTEPEFGATDAGQSHGTLFNDPVVDTKPDTEKTALPKCKERTLPPPLTPDYGATDAGK